MGLGGGGALTPPPDAAFDTDRRQLYVAIRGLPKPTVSTHTELAVSSMIVQPFGPAAKGPFFYCCTPPDQDEPTAVNLSVLNCCRGPLKGGQSEHSNHLNIYLPLYPTCTLVPRIQHQTPSHLFPGCQSPLKSFLELGAIWGLREKPFIPGLSLHAGVSKCLMSAKHHKCCKWHLFCFSVVANKLFFLWNEIASAIKLLRLLCKR